MKQALSRLFYFLGDTISRTLLRAGIGYGLYRAFMLWSLELDEKFNVWKEVKPKRRKKK
jgi:hypothetical protein